MCAQPALPAASAAPPRMHPVAETGYQSASAVYQRGRPDYPPSAVAFLAQRLGVRRGSVVVEVGAGTGKFTRCWLPYAPATVAMEPVAGMRERLRRELPGLRVLAGTAEALPFAPASVDALVCAQSFHWFDAPAALREFRRVLRPGGRLALIWNVRDLSLPWSRAVENLVFQFHGEAPRYHSGRWRQAFAQPNGFTPLRLACFAYQHPGGRAMVRDRVASTSFIATLPPPERDRVMAAVETLLDQFPQTRGEGTFAVPYRTEVYWCQALPFA